MKHVLEVTNLKKYYKNKGSITKAVDRIHFVVDPGEFVGIMGASGSGKTTLLNVISTIDQPTAGSVLLEGKEITAMKERELAKFRREKLGFIFQDYNLLNTLTGRENIALALTMIGESYRTIDKKVQEIASFLGIDEIIDKYPFEMSGGQRQRVACARAIVTKPRLILADEPTGALDSKSASKLLQNFKMMNNEYQATILMVTHDAYTASHCKRIIFLKDGKIFSEMIRGEETRVEFFEKIMQVIAVLGEIQDEEK